MKAENISFIIPVYNRPDEIKELLSSMSRMEGSKLFEVVVVEDGSEISSEEVVNSFRELLRLKYHFKRNTGPGDSRNYGMQQASGDYFIILDSDCLLPPKYLNAVLTELRQEFVHCFGGPDSAHTSFTDLQKAIDFSMTSFITTGGIRGSKSAKKGFQPRSFNMGLSREAFESSGGFGRIHPGEDPDLVLRLRNKGFETRLFPDAFVFHKRRISWSKFYRQVFKFGMVRAILNRWHPYSRRLTYWFPTVFISGLILAIAGLLAGYPFLLSLYGIYFILVLVLSWMRSGSLKVGILTVWAVLVQFGGYGWGFLKSNLRLLQSDKKEEELFPELFFKL